MSHSDRCEGGQSSRRRFLKIGGVVAATGLAGCSGGGGGGGGESTEMSDGGSAGTTTGTSESSLSGPINAFLWEGWEPVVEAFTEETGIEVNQENATGTNQMFTKVNSAPENYDLVCPNSGYGVRFREAGLVQPVADSQEAFTEVVPNFANTFNYFQQGTIANHLSGSDGGWYGAPPRYGLYGLAYDSDTIDGDQLQSSADIWDNSAMWEDDVGLNVDLVHSITHAVRALGYTDMLRGEQMEVTGQAWEETREKFLEMADFVRARFESEAQFGRAMTGDSYNVGVGPGRNDVINLIQNGNTNFEYTNPSEGAIGWTEAMFVTETTDKVAECAEFMNFILTETAGAELATADLAPSTVEEARGEMSEEEIELFYVSPDVVETAIQDKAFANPDQWQQLGNEFRARLSA